MLQGTARAWIEAITHGRSWKQERDQARVRQAFIVLSSLIRRWPSPAEFLDALPRPEAQRALTKQHIPADPVRAAAAISEVREMLRPRRTDSGEGAEQGP